MTAKTRPLPWGIILIDRLGLEIMDADSPEIGAEHPLKRRFATKAEAVKYARERFGGSKLDRAGWRVARNVTFDKENRIG